MLSGAWTVLTPTFRQAFGLSLVGVGLLTQVLEWVATIVEPVAGGLIDVRSRRALLATGALALGGSLLLMAGSTSGAMLLAAFALYGFGSGPLANTADVLVVETFPTAPSRAYARATFVDTVGALIGPAVVALATVAGVDWRIVLAMLGAATVTYGAALAATPFPSPRGAGAAVPALWANGRAVLADRATRRALAALLCLDLFEAAFVLKYVWLHESVGLSQSLVAVYAGAEQVVALAALAVLDRWLARADAGRLLRTSAIALAVLPALWVASANAGAVACVAVGVPLAFAHALLWPITKSRALTASPGLAGATQAVSSLFAVIPFAIAETLLAEAIGTGTAMAVTAAAGAALLARYVRTDA